MPRKRQRQDRSLLVYLLPVQTVFRPHLNATSCVSLRLVDRRFRDLVESWRQAKLLSGQSCKIYHTRACLDCGDWACTIQEVGMKVTWICSYAKPGETTCHKRFCCHGCDCSQACCCPGGDCPCDCHRDIAVLLANPVPSSVPARFAVVKLAYPGPPEVRLVTRDQIQHERLVEALVDAETKLIRPNLDDVSCFVPLEAGGVILQVHEFEALHDSYGLVLCDTRDEAAKRAASWFKSFPQDEFDPEGSRCQIYRELQTSNVYLVGGKKFTVYFEILNF